jgi:glycogen phosphorylase
VMAGFGQDFHGLVEGEPDAALGNGGLGRLAACFMESMATVGCPAYGYGIRYEHGLFKQSFQGGQQAEMPEDWLSMTNPWEFARPESAYVIPFKGEVKTEAGREVWLPSETVLASAYDTPVIGWQGKCGFGRQNRRNSLIWNALTGATMPPPPNPRHWPAP